MCYSNGRVPKYGSLGRVWGRTDFFDPAAFPPACENRCTFLLARTPLQVPVIIPVRKWPFQGSLQVKMLSGANFHAKCAFPLNLLKHGGVSTNPGHLGHLRDRDTSLANLSEIK